MHDNLTNGKITIIVSFVHLTLELNYPYCFVFASSKKEFKLKEIFLCLYPLRAHWQTIGTILNVDKGTLATIRADNDSAEDRLNGIITTWLRQISPPPTWNLLADAVKVIDPNRSEEIKILFS